MQVEKWPQGADLYEIEMLATAVAMNLEGAPTHMQEEAVAKNPIVAAIMGGMNPRHFISSAMSALVEDANGTPFNGSWVVVTGNLVSDMHANVAAESSGRLLSLPDTSSENVRYKAQKSPLKMRDGPTTSCLVACGSYAAGSGCKVTW